MINIRIAEKSDAASIAQIEKECFSAPWSAEDITVSMDFDTVFFVADEKGICVSYCGAQITADGAFITNVATANAHRRRGLGEGVLLALIEHLKAKSVPTVSLEVRKSNLSAIGLYEKLGFSVVGERKRFYKNPTEDAFIMTRMVK